MNRALWMKGICLIWSRGQHFSPSLPDRGPTGIWNLAHSISDARAEISGILVMVRHSSATSRLLLTGSSIFAFLCSRYLICACANLLNLIAYHNQETWCTEGKGGIDRISLWWQVENKKKKGWSNSERNAVVFYHPIFRKGLPFFIRVLQVVNFGN